MSISPDLIAFKHEMNALKDKGDKNHVDKNVSEHGISQFERLILYEGKPITGPDYINRGHIDFLVVN